MVVLEIKFVARGVQVFDGNVNYVHNLGYLLVSRARHRQDFELHVFFLARLRCNGQDGITMEKFGRRSG